MSLIKKLFGGQKIDKAPSPQEAIQDLRGIEEMLQKKSDFLEQKISSELATAKKHGTKNKRAALMALKRKKRLETQLTQIDGTLTTIEYQREALENASTNTHVLTAMNTAAKSLKAAHNHMNVDDVHNLMDDIQEQNELAQEISEAISNPVGFGNEIDEDELEAELEGLEQEELDKQLLNMDVGATELPSVPAEPMPTKKTAVEDDDDFKELEAWAS